MIRRSIVAAVAFALASCSSGGVVVPAFSIVHSGGAGFARMVGDDAVLALVWVALPPGASVASESESAVAIDEGGGARVDATERAVFRRGDVGDDVVVTAAVAMESGDEQPSVELSVADVDDAAVAGADRRANVLVLDARRPGPASVQAFALDLADCPSGAGGSAAIEVGAMRAWLRARVDAAAAALIDGS